MLDVDWLFTEVPNKELYVKTLTTRINGQTCLSIRWSFSSIVNSTDLRLVVSVISRFFDSFSPTAIRNVVRPSDNAARMHTATHDPSNSGKHKQTQ